MLIAFIVMPLIELAVLIQVGGWLGLWPTLGLIVLTAIVGTWMLRRQGFAVLTRAQQQLAEGGVPLGEVFEGFCLVIAGALLLTPGFVTDAIGGSLLMPPVRTWLYRTLGGRLREAAMPGNWPPGQGAPDQGGPGQGPSRHGPSGRGPVMDGEFETVDPEAKETDAENKLKDMDVPEPKSGPMPPPRGRWDGKR